MNLELVAKTEAVLFCIWIIASVCTLVSVYKLETKPNTATAVAACGLKEQKK